MEAVNPLHFDINSPRSYLLGLLKQNPAWDTDENRDNFWAMMYLMIIKMVHPHNITPEMFQQVTDDNITELFNKYPEKRI